MMIIYINQTIDGNQQILKWFKPPVNQYQPMDKRENVITHTDRPIVDGQKVSSTLVTLDL